jgi:dTDP-4-dehydrorhamnose reductase
VLIAGAGGYLGREVARQASAAGHAVTGPPSADLDITSRSAVLTLTNSVRPDVIVNAAYRASSWTACADGGAIMALAAVACGARLIHVSSDAVHRGRPAPYLDDDEPTPIFPYGAAKAAAETAVAAIDPAAAIVRTSLIIGDAHSKQITMALDLAAGRRPGALFTDEYRRPVDVHDLAAAILELASTDYSGLLNIAGPQTLSRAELGRLAALRYGADPAAIPICPTAEGGLGPRPGNVLLDSTRAESLLTTRLRPASESLAG